MENIKFQDCNLMVYVKSSIAKKYEPLQSLQTFTIAPNLLYVALFPYEKLERLTEWLKSNEENAKKNSLSFQIRSSKNRRKILFQLN
jgi:hypothetical protein